MTEAEIAQFKDALESRLAGLARQHELGSEGRKSVTLDQTSIGRLSRMDALQGQAMAKATAALREGQVRRIRAALARIEEGEFGFCTDCAEAIPLARLRLDPAVPKCIDCSA